MSYYDEYRQKLKTPEEAVQVVKDGDWIDYTISQGQPVLLDAALANRIRSARASRTTAGTRPALNGNTGIRVSSATRR